MDRVDVFRFGQLNDRVDIQIAADWFAGLANLVGLVSLRTVAAEPVFVGVDGHGPNAELVRRAKNANCDLAAIGGHQFFERGHWQSGSIIE